MPDDTIWEADPHTFMKHHILRKYLGAWYPKLGLTHGRCVFIDGFAGPGEYATGEPGSPVVAIDALLEHTADLSKCNFVYVFIEQDTRRAAHLEELLTAKRLPKNLSTKVINDSFAPTVTRVLDSVESSPGRLAPSFVMIDPFGWTGFPYDLVSRLAKHQRSEVLVSLMFETMNRFLTNPEQAVNMDALFGTTEWRDAIALPPAERKAAILDLYRGQLTVAGFTYTYAFELRDTQNKTEYFLVHGTKHLDGLDAMKRAMWSADGSGKFSFSDWTEAKHQGQMTLIGDELDDDDVRRRVREYLEGKGWVNVNAEMLAWLLVETPYHSGQYKQRALGWLENEGIVEVDHAGKRKNYWNTGTKVRLLRQ